MEAAFFGAAFFGTGLLAEGFFAAGFFAAGAFAGAGWWCWCCACWAMAGEVVTSATELTAAVKIDFKSDLQMRGYAANMAA
ncbi:MAG TPA: hypothetical protein VNH53_00955 [Sphingomicrobium sp.]|nr:hypothetical protein [Sphingomicrobium sp.]